MDSPSRPIASPLSAADTPTALPAVINDPDDVELHPPTSFTPDIKQEINANSIPEQPVLNNMNHFDPSEDVDMEGNTPNRASSSAPFHQPGTSTPTGTNVATPSRLSALASVNGMTSAREAATPPPRAPAQLQPANVNAAHGAPVRRYLNERVTGAVLDGMKMVAREQPADPLRMLGEFLLEKSKEFETTT